MKKLYFCKLCLIVFGALWAVQNISANEREAVYSCAGEQSVFLASDENERTTNEQFVLRLNDKAIEVVNDGFFKDGYTFPVKELPNELGGVTAGFGGHTLIFVRPHFFYSFTNMSFEKSQMTSVLIGRCEVL